MEALNEGNLEQILASAAAGVQAAEEQAATLRQRQSDLAAELAQAEGDPAKIEELTPAVEEATAANSWSAFYGTGLTCDAPLRRERS